MRTITLENGQTVKISEESFQNLAKATKNRRWKPEHPESYFFVNVFGRVADERWTDHPMDDALYKRRNLFKTRGQAEEKAASLRKKYEILNRIEELNEGWWPDWKDESSSKYSITYEHADEKYCINANWQSQKNSNEFYFKSKEIGHKLIKEFVDDLKHLFTL